MTLDQAKDIVRQYYRVKKAAGDKEFTLPQALVDARQLLSDDAIAVIEEEVNGEE